MESSNSKPSADDETQIVLLESRDKKIFKVTKKMALLSKTIELGLIDADENDPVPLLNVNSEILEHIIRWAEYHQNDSNLQNEYRKPMKLSEWDSKFLENLDKRTFFEVIEAANYLEIIGLLDCTCLKIASLIMNKTPEQIRTNFGLNEKVIGDSSEKKKEK